MDHIIHTQIMDISIFDLSKVNEIQQLLSEHFRNSILQDLERLFDEYSNEKDWLLIDQLEIDLGTVCYSDVIKKSIQQEWVQKIHDQIRLYLLDPKQYSKIGYRKVSLPERALEQWLFYMQKGYLPWSTDKIPDQWERQILEQLASDYPSIQLFRNFILSNPQILVRIIRQHESSFLELLLETILADSQKKLQYIIHEIATWIVLIQNGSNAKYIQEKRIEELIWDYIFQNSIEAPEKTIKYKWVPDFIESWVNNVNTNSANITRELVMQFVGLLNQLPISDPEVKQLQKQVYEIIWNRLGSGIIDKGDIGIPDEMRKHSDVRIENSQTLNNRAFYEKLNEYDNLFERQSELTENNPEDNELYLNHVGLILLHPFFNRLFKRLNYTASGEFISKETQLKAIYLLHFIATGSISAKEFELAIPKLLCGAPLEIPIDDVPEYRIEELEEAETMMNGAIEQWKPGLLSIQALRYNFLQRSGFWKTRHEQFVLRPEKNAVDILLRTSPVPWNLSIVKLSWLKNRIVVEWV